MTKTRAQLTIVGCGLHPGHMTLETVSLIKAADIVLVVAPNPLSINHIKTLNANVEHLGRYYGDDLDRSQIYQAMAEEMVAKVVAGLNVCTVFYGHPGIFVTSTHVAKQQLLARGLPVKMYPGVSADACLFADLDLDPATTGCQSYEATQFLLTHRKVDTGAALILWQIGLVGEHTLRQYKPAENGLAAMQRLLLTHYPPEHSVCVYEAPTLPGFEPRIEWFALSALNQISMKEWSTLYVPCASDLIFAEERLPWLGLTREDFSAWH